MPSAQALLFRVPDPLRAAPIRSIPDLIDITVVENTGGNIPHVFSPTDARWQREPGTLTAVTQDFAGTPTERYDVFYSNSDGLPNANGSYISVEAIADQEAPSGGGLNISEIRLNRTSGVQLGNVVSSAVYLGNNAIPKSAALVVDGNPATDCTMGNTVGLGNQRMRVTIGFGTPSEDFRGGVDTEVYDVFYSNADGTINNNGSYISIEATWDHPLPSGGGLNISEVRLDRGPQSEYGNIVSSWVYNGDNSDIASDGYLLAADGDPATDCSMGNTIQSLDPNQRLRVTIGFASSSGGTPNPTELYCSLESSFTVACNPGSSGHTIAHIVNQGSFTRSVDWMLDTAGQFIAQPASGSAVLSPFSDTAIPLDITCSCPPRAGNVIFRVTNQEANDCVEMATWNCDVIVGSVPALSSWLLFVLVLSLLGLGLVVLQRSRAAGAADRTV